MVKSFTIIFAFFAIGNAAVPAFAEKPAVLHVSSYHPEYLWTASNQRGLETHLDPRIKLITHYLNTKRRGPAEYPGITEQAWQAYLTVKPDLVVLGDDNALKLLGSKVAAESLPVVFYGINANPRIYFPDRRIPENVTGVLERPLFLNLLAAIKHIVPDTTSVLVLLDSSTTSEGLSEIVFGGRQALFLRGLTVITRTLANFVDWREAVLTAGAEYQAILIGSFFTVRNDDNVVIEPIELLNWTSANSVVPVFGTLDFTVGDRGAVGALVVDGELHGSRAARKVNSILFEDGFGQIELDDEGSYIFNKLQMQRFGLTLPKSIASEAKYQ